MSFELARRLVRRGAVEPRDVETALLASVARRVGFVQALIDLGPDVGRAVLRELGELPQPAVHTVRIDAVLVRRLPVGMCERLLAVPLATDASGSVMVSAVDPLDAHVEHEFAFQLGARVRVVRAAYADLVTALDVLQGGLKRPRAWRTEPIEAGDGPPSAPPIPLVRRADGSATQAGRPQAESSRAAVAATGSRAPQAESSQPASSTRLVPKPRPPLEQIQTPILAATSPLELIGGLRLALSTEAKRVLVFAVKEGVFEALQGQRDPIVEPLRGKASEPSVLSSALAAGYYLGRLKQTALDRAIEDALKLPPGEELYAVPVLVSGRAALMVLAAGLEGALETTRRIDELSRIAGVQLEQIVRSRKRPR